MRVLKNQILILILHTRSMESVLGTPTQCDLIFPCNILEASGTKEKPCRCLTLDRSRWFQMTVP